MKKLGLFVLTLVSVSQAQSIPTRQEAVLVTEMKQFANLMPMVGPSVGSPVQTSLAVKVLSSGCTVPEDFQVRARVTRSGQFLEIARIREDCCKMVSHEITVNLVTENLQLASQMPIIFVNPALVDEQVVY